MAKEDIVWTIDVGKRGAEVFEVLQSSAIDCVSALTGALPEV
jgi:hypothetical protein